MNIFKYGGWKPLLWGAIFGAVLGLGQMHKGECVGGDTAKICSGRK